MNEKLLRVNLRTGKIRDEKIGEDKLKKFLGGRGLGEHLLYGETKPGIDPLGPENRLYLMVGPATGTPWPTSGRYHVVTKSPLTGGIGDANSGGKWGPELRFSGYMGIAIEDSSDEPVYLWIKNGLAELRSADKYWGTTVWQTEDALKRDLGDDKIQIASIGPGGENLVPYAGILTDKHRAAGRTGVGAVMGSKKLKAVAVRGTKKPFIADRKKLEGEVKKATKKLTDPDSVCGNNLPKYGTAALINTVNENGILPTRNFQTGVFPKADDISGETIKETILTGQYACWNCPIGCGRVSKITQIPYQIEGHGPEYETDWSLGSDCDIANLGAITKAHNTCDELGIDPISLGATIACAMELNEKGKLPKDIADGMDLNWGNEQTIVDLSWKTAYRAGFGKEIAMGAKKLAEKYGAPELAMEVKGLELPAYDPRGVQGHALGYATSNRGGCHLRAYVMAAEVVGEAFGDKKKKDRFSTVGKAQLVKTIQDAYSVLDSAVVCKFISFPLGPQDYTDLLNPITGWNWSVDELMKTGERIYNLERMYINREGFDGKDDTLPKRFLEEPMPEGPAKGHVVKLKEMLSEYYKVRGWTNGKPTKEKLRELNLP